MTAKRIVEMANAFYADENGVTAIEYALLGALIAVVIASSVGLVGNAVEALFAKVAGGFP